MSQQYLLKIVPKIIYHESAVLHFATLLKIVPIYWKSIS